MESYQSLILFSLDILAVLEWNPRIMEDEVELKETNTEEWEKVLQEVLLRMGLSDQRMLVGDMVNKLHTHLWQWPLLLYPGVEWDGVVLAVLRSMEKSCGCSKGIDNAERSGWYADLEDMLALVNRDVE